MNDGYAETYFRCNNYATYLERQERYEKMIQELHYDLFRKIKLDFTKAQVLDFGCAVGFCVKAFKDLGYVDAHGYDTSEWAINWGREHLRLHDRLHCKRFDDPWTNFAPFMECSLMTAFDVLEHMKKDEIEQILDFISPQHLLVRLPLATVDDGTFVLPVSENDPTHITRMTRHSWLEFLKECGYEHMFFVNLGLFYDTEGVMCGMFRRID